MSPSSRIKAPQGLLRYVILAYASRYPVTGAELSTEVRARTQGLWDPSPGSVYFLMNELKERNLIVGVKGGDPARKAYIATKEGRAALAKASDGLLGELEREVTLLAFFASMVDPSSTERMEFLKWALKADSAAIQRAKQQGK